MGRRSGGRRRAAIPGEHPSRPVGLPLEELAGEQLVYVIVAHGTGALKIGRTGDLPRRLGELQTGSPFDLEPVRTYLVGNARVGALVEAALHEQLERCALRGEWFQPVKPLEEILEELDSAALLALGMA